MFNKFFRLLIRALVAKT